MRFYKSEIEAAYHLSFHFYSGQKFSPKVRGMDPLIESKEDNYCSRSSYAEGSEVGNQSPFGI